MRTSEYYGVDVPELGDRADITVVSQAIIDGENNQSGKVEHLKATNSGTTIILNSETRIDKLIKYYNGLSVQFVSPIDMTAGNSYKIQIDNLAEQPYNNKTDIKTGDIVQAHYGASGFMSSNTPIPRSSSISSSSEVTVATSLAVKNANDNANTRALKSVQVVAGKGLTGGGDMSTNRTIDVVSRNDGIIVNDNDIQLNVYDGVDSSSTTRAGSAKAVKTAYDKGVEALDKANAKLDAGDVTEDYNTAEKIEDKIKSSIELANTKLDKGSEDLKLSNAELIVKAIESNQGLKFDTILNIDDVGTKQEGYCYMFEGDIYKCIKQTEATTPESANFHPISNNKLNDRLDNLIKNRKYKSLYDMQRVEITASGINVVKVPDDIDIVDVIIAIPAYSHERVTFTVARGFSENLPFYSAGAFYKAFRVYFLSSGDISVSTWDSASTTPMMVGVYYQS